MASARCTMFLTVLFISLAFLDQAIVSRAQTLFLFGDSLYDAGNKQYLTDKPVAANLPPYGMSVGKPTGRWSDGLIVPDYVAEFLGIPHVPPILEDKANLSYGANFAVAGASVLGDSFETMTLSDQAQKFAESKKSWTNEERSGAIYLFYIGSVDYLNYTEKYPDATEKQRLRFVDEVIAGVEEALTSIYEAGARKFAFQNLAPLGCLPIVKQQHDDKKNCVTWISNIAAEHNKKLLHVLEKMEQNLEGFQFTVYDFFSSIQKRVGRSEAYTFNEVNEACCGLGSLHAKDCGVRKSAKACEKPAEYLFFDGKHGTQETNKQTAHLMFSANPGVVGPNNLRELYVLPLDIKAKLGHTPRAAEPVADDNPLEGLTNKAQKMSDVELLEWGFKNSFSYQLDGAASVYM